MWGINTVSHDMLSDYVSFHSMYIEGPYTSQILSISFSVAISV